MREKESEKEKADLRLAEKMIIEWENYQKLGE